MPLKCHPLCILLVGLSAGVATGPAEGQDAGDPLPAANLAGVRGAAQLLGQELDSAEQYIVLVLRKGQEERSLYKEADAAVGQLRKFTKSLIGNPTRQQATKDFAPLSDKVDKLLKHVNDRFTLDAPLRLIANRIRAAQVEVRYNLLLGDTAEGSARELLQSQVSALLAAVENLNATGQYVLGQDINQAGLLTNMQSLVQATRKFQLQLAGGTMGAELSQAFTLVSSNWQMVVNGITMTSTQEIVGLYGSMTKADTAYGRVHRLLGIGGIRPTFQIPD